jgi:hypothetical protein
MFLFVGVLHKIFIHKCAPDAVIWSEQQLLVNPGWLHQYQNARLVQEGQLTSIKRPRLLISKKNKAKQRTITVRRGGIRWQPKPSSPPPPPSSVATLGSGPAGFQKNLRICGKSGGFEKKVADLRQARRSRVWGDLGGLSLNPLIS